MVGGLHRKSCGRRSVQRHGKIPANTSREPLGQEPSRKVVSGKHSIFIHFPKDRNCEVRMRSKISGAPCRRRIGFSVHRAENFGDLITADREVLCEGCESRNNHWHAVVVQDSATRWIQSYHCKTKTSQETDRSSRKFLEPSEKPKVIDTDNTLEFSKACEDSSWNDSTSTPHRSETNGIAQRALRRIWEGTSAVLLQSGLDEKWWADSMESYCYLRNIQGLVSDGKTPYERRFGEPFKGPIIQFDDKISPYFCQRSVKTCQEIRARRLDYICRHHTIATAICGRGQENKYFLGRVAGQPNRWLLDHRWRSKPIWTLDWFHAVHRIFNGKTPDEHMWSGERLKTMQATTRPDHLWPESWSEMSKAAQRNEKQQWAVEKLKLDNTRKLRGIHFIDPEDIELKETMKNERKSWNCPSNLPCLLRWRRASTGRPVDDPTTANQSMHAS